MKNNDGTLFNVKGSGHNIKSANDIVNENKIVNECINESNNEHHNSTHDKTQDNSTKIPDLTNQPVKYGEPVNLELIDGITKEPIPLVKILFAGTETPIPTELNSNHMVKITDANNENNYLIMDKNRKITMIDITSSSKPENISDTFILRPEIGQLEIKEYEQKISKDPIKYNDKIAIALWSKKGNSTYSGCGWFGCRVLKPSTSFFGHGGKNRDEVPYTTISAAPLPEPIIQDGDNHDSKNNNKDNNKDNCKNYNKEFNNDILLIDVDECKYSLSQLDHILIEQNNVDKLEQEILNKDDWEKMNAREYVAAGLRNIILKNCKNKIVQNINIRGNITNTMKSYKNDDNSFNLPTIYIMYSLSSYNDDQDFLNYIRTMYTDSIIQIIGTYNFGISKINTYSYQDLINKMSSNNDHQDNNTPDCAKTTYGCCPDGITNSDDLFGTNCKPVPCSFSSFGCCKDGVTSAIDNMGSNCPVISNTQNTQNNCLNQ